MKFGQKNIPVIFYSIILVYLSYCILFTPNFGTTLIVVIYPLFAFRLLWVDRQTNVLFWGMGFQWLTSATQLLYCNFLRITLVERSNFNNFAGNRMEDATVYSMIGLFFFTLGLFLVIKNIKHREVDFIISAYSPRRILNVYIGISITVFICSAFIWNFPLIVQYFHFFFYIKWGFFVVTFYIIHKNGRILRPYLYSIIGIEVLLSLTSFFAGNFLNITTFFLLSLIMLQTKLKLRSYIFIVVATIGISFLLILWSAIKVDYRSFVSSGEVTQLVKVSRSEANDKLISLINNVNEQQFKEGIEKFVDRVGYIQFFAATLDYVPKNVPHQNGDVYLSAVQHYLIPRFIDKNKNELDDSKHTRKFTGIELSGKESATSFSLGYIADAYIDFGSIYMHILLFFFGALFGVFYRFLYEKAPNEMWSWIFTAPFFLLININGTDTSKALGWVLIYFLVIAIIRKQLIKILDPLMQDTIN
jgi:hypothetical protein